MKMRQSFKNGSHILMEVPQRDFKFWDNFCEFYIQKCERLIENHPLEKEELKHFQTIKENLEMILFTIDVNQTDPRTTIEFESSYLALFLSMMERWVALLQQGLKIEKQHLADAKNGENKRQISNEIDKNRYLIETNKRIIEAIQTFMKAA